MRRRIPRPAPAVLAVALLAASGAAGQPLLELEPVAGGLDRPLLLTHAGDGSGRLFVVEQTGRVRIVAGGELLAEPFADLSDRISCCGERGLLGLAFHPRYRSNGLFYVAYTAGNGDSVVSRLRVSADPDRADPGSEVEVLRFAQPFGNHNGGHLAFGPDGLLYVASGDGGSGGDPQDNGQSLDTLLGKLLRIDVDGGAPYAVPPGNPFVGQAGAREEIWAYGLRNPWRFSFDRATGDLYIADVGQNRFEELNFQPGGARGGANYGWRLREGASCFDPPTGCEAPGLTDPVVVYGHDVGCSITGGYRYRGPDQPTLSRFYVYGDFCSGRIWGARSNRAGAFRSRRLVDSGLSISSFGEDEAGRLYVVGLGGEVRRLAGRPLFADDFESGDLAAWSRRRGRARAVAPGLSGSGFALEVPVDGTRRRSFVQSSHPASESTFEACFRLSAADLDLAAGEIEIARLAGPAAHTRLVLERPGRRLKLRLETRDPGAPWVAAGSTRVPRRRAARFCLGWFRATAAAAADGEAELRKNGRLRARADGLASFGLRVGQVRLGLPAGSAGRAVAGRLLLDDYVSTP